MSSNDEEVGIGPFQLQAQTYWLMSHLSEINLENESALEADLEKILVLLTFRTPGTDYMKTFMWYYVYDTEPEVIFDWEDGFSFNGELVPTSPWPSDVNVKELLRKRYGNNWLTRAGRIVTDYDNYRTLKLKESELRGQTGTVVAVDEIIATNGLAPKSDLLPPKAGTTKRRK